MLDFAIMTLGKEGYHSASNEGGGFFGLSPRRLEVFDDWIKGKTISQTAEATTLTEKTVKTYRREISLSICERCSDSLPMEGPEETRIRRSLTRAVIARVAGLMADGVRIDVGVPADVVLTPKESEVGGLMLKGMSKEEVSKRLHYKRSLTETLFGSIYSKLGLGDLRGEKYVPAVARLTVLAMGHMVKGNNVGTR